MGLSIAVFVPEGIVIACDGLAEIRNLKGDQGFLHNKQKRLFVYQNRFLINIHGSGYFKGMPCAFYVEKIFNKLNDASFSNVSDFSERLNKEMSCLQEDGQKLSFYAMGMEEDATNNYIPTLILSDNGKIMTINRGMNNNIVYNYHSVGHSLWLNKMLLPTSFEMENGKKVDFENIDIDFSKYSLDDAIEFSKTLFNISRQMDNIAQLKQMVGDILSYGILNQNNNISIVKEFKV